MCTCMRTCTCTYSIVFYAAHIQYFLTSFEACVQINTHSVTISHSGTKAQLLHTGTHSQTRLTGK